MPTAEEVKASKEITLDKRMPGYPGDTDVAQHRAPGARISRPNQLTAWEKCRLNDLARARLGVKLGCRREEVTLTLESRKELLDQVFDRWNSSSSRGTRDLTLKSGGIRDTSFKAGTWSRDLCNESKDDKKQKSSKVARHGTTKPKKTKPSKKRKRNEEHDEEPPKKLEKQQESRLCSAEAFLYMVLADGAPIWKWRDASGQTASGRSIDYHDVR